MKSNKNMLKNNEINSNKNDTFFWKKYKQKNTYQLGKCHVMAHLKGFKPSTFWSEVKCSIQLS